jgi:hypothetical protein
MLCQLQLPSVCNTVVPHHVFASMVNFLTPVGLSVHETSDVFSAEQMIVFPLQATSSQTAIHPVCALHGIR